jgi:ketosteroid isomerase-like protein
MGQTKVSESSYADIVRGLWSAWERHGLEAMLALTPPDVEWQPVASDGRVLRGAEEVRAFWARQEAGGIREQAVPYRFEEQGDVVLVAGSLRQFAAHGWSDSQPVWGFFFEDGRLRRAVGFRSRAEAREAMNAYNSSA